MKEKKVELSKLIATFDYFQGEKRSYDCIDRFLRKNFSTGPLVVFSLFTKEEDEGKDTHARVWWNRRAFEQVYRELKITHWLEGLDLGKINSNWGKFFEYNDSKFLAIFTGEVKGQIRIAVVELFDQMEEEDRALLNLFCSNLSLHWTRTDEVLKVEDLVYQDDVTGLFNQRRLIKDVDAAILRHKELKEEFSLLFIDIDHFKQVNDGMGHLVGTTLLAELGKVIKNTLRETDLIYRYGGDEFVVLLQDVGVEYAKLVGERLLANIKQQRFDVSQIEGRRKVQPVELTVSIGVAGFPSDAKSRDEVIDVADRLMYEAKKSGRGQVCHTSELISLKRTGSN
jgi:diguanylate cyclase (GGDEF)-like protein